jgi:mRNA interferase RelE/StbE
MPSRWSLSYSSEAVRQLRGMDLHASRRLVKYLEDRVATLDDPRQTGKTLQGSRWGECWRYRCGDYRIIVKILDDELVAMILRVGHRKNVN